MASRNLSATPIDESVSLHPAKIFYIVPASNLGKNTTIIDLTEQLQSSYNQDFTPEFHNKAKQLAHSGSIPTYITLGREHWYSNAHAMVTDSKGQTLAELKAPISSYGVSYISFPEGSTHCDHPITLTPVKIESRAQSFALNSLPYMWSAEGRFKTGRISLWKARAGKRVLVAKYESDSGAFKAGGPLVVETREVDEVVAVLTCLSLLNQPDAFNLPGFRR